MKQAHRCQLLHRYIHKKQQEIQQTLQEFRSQYELSGKTSFLLAQSECQGAMAAYQDILRMYSMHITYDAPGPEEAGLQPRDVSEASAPNTEILSILSEYCQKKHREAEQKIAGCQQRYASSDEKKYVFLQRKYAGEVMVYQNIGRYIRKLSPSSAVAVIAEQPAAGQPPAFESMPGLRHILVLDGSALIRKSIEMILRSEGFEVTTAADGVIGLDIAKKLAPDAILMDSGIARRNEEQLAFILRRERRLRKIPVILLEGTGRDLDDRVSRQLGIVANIKKPFQPDELLQTIKTALPE